MAETDLKQPQDDVKPPERIYQRFNVKVEMPGAASLRVSAPQALISSKDGKLRMMVPVGQVAKRMAQGETVAYFVAEIESHIGVLELGDRITNRGAWW